MTFGSNDDERLNRYKEERKQMNFLHYFAETEMDADTDSDTIAVVVIVAAVAAQIDVEVVMTERMGSLGLNAE